MRGVTENRALSITVGRVFLVVFLCQVPAGCERPWLSTATFSLLSINSYDFGGKINKLFSVAFSSVLNSE